jgi:hypothetical protein
MKTNKLKFFFVLFTIFSFCYGYSQSLIKTSEFNGNKKRRDLYYDNNMNLIKEFYYSNDQKIINEINYDSLNNISRFIVFKEYPKIKLDVNYKTGSYFYPENNVELKFKGDYIFDGKQKGNKIIINYKDGKKNGVLLQTDSGVIGTKTVVRQKVDVRYLKFNIVKYFEDFGSEDVYKLFNGIKLNFSNNLLNGTQNSFYVNGNIKFTSNFRSGILLDHLTKDDNGNIITKINTEDGIIKKPFIQNGLLYKINENSMIKSGSLNEIGDINREYLYLDDNDDMIRYQTLENGTEYGHIGDFLKFGDFEKNEIPEVLNWYEKRRPNYGIIGIRNPMELKKMFDSKKFFVKDENTLRILLSIPIFSLNRFDFNKEENFQIFPVNEFKLDSSLKNFISYTNSFNKFYNSSYENLEFHLILQEEGKEYETKEKVSNQKEYLYDIINKTIFNIFEFENKTYNYIDPFSTNLFGKIKYSYKRLVVFERGIRGYGEEEDRHDSNIKIYSNNKDGYIIIKNKFEIIFCNANLRYKINFEINSNGDLKVKNIEKEILN